MICNVTVSKSQLSGTLYFQKDKLLNYQIQYPLVNSTSLLAQLVTINNYYEKIALNFQTYCLNNLLTLAYDGHKYARQYQYPLIPYEAQMDYSVTYNKNCMISLFYDQYTFTGGAHGSTVRTSDTWNAATGKKITLKEFFPLSADYKANLLADLNNQIQKLNNTQANNYVEHYSENTKTHFNEQQFYLTENGIAVYYQQYDIAPYSSGIPVFIIPFQSK